MKLIIKKIDDLTPLQIDWALAEYAYGWQGISIEHDPAIGRYVVLNDPLQVAQNGGNRVFMPTLDWQIMSKLINQYHIGFEGNSAWAWKDGRCHGYANGNTLKAIGMTILRIVNSHDLVSVPEA